MKRRRKVWTERQFRGWKGQKQRVVGERTRQVVHSDRVCKRPRVGLELEERGRTEWALVRSQKLVPATGLQARLPGHLLILRAKSEVTLVL